eukprot:1918130-Rhodomonas_salina.5
MAVGVQQAAMEADMLQALEVCSHAPATPSLVLTWCIALRACDAMSGTDVVFGATRLPCDVRYEHSVS